MKGIQLVVDHFKELGHPVVVAFLRLPKAKKITMKEKENLKKMYEEGNVGEY